MKILLNSYADKTINLFSSKNYAYIFCLAYSLILTFNVYPGFLYSDSIARWDNAIMLASEGFDGFSKMDFRSPFVPTIFMAISYCITNETGFFNFIQIFCVSYSIFLFSNCFSHSWARNLFSSLLLILPINYIYAAFSTYDTLISVILLNIAILFLKENKNFLDGIFLSALIASAIGTRYPAIIIVPAFYLTLYKQKKLFVSLINYRLTLLMSFILIFFILFIPFSKKPNNIENMDLPIAFNANPFFDGIAWEYQNFASQSNDLSDISFLNSIGLTQNETRLGLSYRSIWENNFSGYEFMNRIPMKKKHELLKNYVSFALKNPGIYIVEKSKYAADLIGISKPLDEYEINKFKDPVWKKKMEHLGFYKNARKEALAKLYELFNDGIGSILRTPYLVIVLISLLTFFMRNKNKYIVDTSMLVILYFLAYFVNCPSHELRYFYPVVYYFTACLAASSGLLHNFISKRANMLSN